MVDFSQVGTIVCLVTSIIIVLFLASFCYLINHKPAVSISSFVLGLGIIMTWMFKLNLTTYLLISMYLILHLIIMFSNLNSFRNCFLGSGKPFKFSLKFNKKSPVKSGAKIFDTKSMYKEISEAVNIMSQTKTGAIITFQRKDELKGYMKNGVTLNCSIKKELLLTIFYEGTRLHDGAVVIKDDRIIAASVYYSPTTRPLVGKFGSRHRAALGISETTDSITVVCSEETGRISIAQHGSLEPVSSENFLRVFTEIMDADY
ncbi:MAG: DNA integrity scanning protein DisA nucleotide-binding domain protein [Bacilli bacterium]